MTAPDRIWINGQAVDVYFIGFAALSTPAPTVGKVKLWPEYIHRDAPAEIVATMPAVQALLQAERDKALEQALTAVADDLGPREGLGAIRSIQRRLAAAIRAHKVMP